MIVACYSTQPHDRRSLEAAATGSPIEWRWLDVRLDAHSAPLAAGAAAVCCFVNDRLDAAALGRLADLGVKLVALRCAGFNQVDLDAARRLGLPVVRVPEYSPHAVAEHTVGLMLTLVRRLHKAYARVRDGNFALEGLLGFDLHGKTAGIVGTGRIGARVAEILLGFGCRVIAHDPGADPRLAARGVTYLPLDDVIAGADILTLHCPLTRSTHHLVDARRIAAMKRGVLLVNTSRGGLVDTRAVIAALKTGQIGLLGLDVYEEEAGLFFLDHSDEIIGDDVFMRLLTFPNVVVTAHQAFFTQEALAAIAEQTVRNLVHLERGEALEALVGA